MNTNYRNLLIAGLLGAALSACGGGGGNSSSTESHSSSSSSTTTTTTTPSGTTTDTTTTVDGKTDSSHSSTGTVVRLPPVQPLAKHALMGFWRGGSGLPLSAVGNDWDVVVVSVSANLDLKGDAETAFKNEIKAKQQQGKRVVLALGSADYPLAQAWASDKDQTKFIVDLIAFINRYQFDGADIVLPADVAPTMLSPPWGLVTQIALNLTDKDKFGPGFYLSLEAPRERAGDYASLIEMLGDKLTVLRTSFSATDADQLVATARMWLEGFDYQFKLGNGQLSDEHFAGLHPYQMVLTVPSSSASVTDVSDALNCLTRRQCGAIAAPAKTYSDLRGVMASSINDDPQGGNNFSALVKDILQKLP